MFYIIKNNGHRINKRNKKYHYIKFFFSMTEYNIRKILNYIYFVRAKHSGYFPRKFFLNMCFHFSQAHAFSFSFFIFHFSFFLKLLCLSALLFFGTTATTTTTTFYCITTIRTSTEMLLSKITRISTIVSTKFQGKFQGRFLL